MFVCSTVVKGRTYYRVRKTYRDADGKIKHLTISLGTNPSVEDAFREREAKYFAARKGRRDLPFTYRDYEPFILLYLLESVLFETPKSGHVRSRRMRAECKRCQEWQRAQDRARSRIMGAARRSQDWDILGLRPGSSPEDIKSAYRRKARQYHPDHGGSDEAMKQINAAKAALLGK
jgi:hypothetical protein